MHMVLPILDIGRMLITEGLPRCTQISYRLLTMIVTDMLLRNASSHGYKSALCEMAGVTSSHSLKLIQLVAFGLDGLALKTSSHYLTNVVIDLNLVPSVYG